MTYAIKYIRTSSPSSFILENVQGLLRIDNGRVFDWIIKELQKGDRYVVSWKVINTKTCGIPQSRPRLYIVGLRRDVSSKPFLFPFEIAPMALCDLLDPGALGDSHLRMPPMTQRSARSNVAAVLKGQVVRRALVQGAELILDIDASSSWRGKPSECSPR